MQVVSPEVMSNLESKACFAGCSEIDFMEKAGHGVALAALEYIKNHHLKPSVGLLCGKGNNAGDAFVAGCYLLLKGCYVVAFQAEPLEHSSPLCKKNGQRFLELGGKISQEMSLLSPPDLLIDGIFGTGFRGNPSGSYQKLIEAANESQKPILAVDIPSGLHGATGITSGAVIRAKETLFLGLPKTGCFIENGWEVVGTLREIPFGLPEALVKEVKGDFELITAHVVQNALPPILRNRHKYQSGHVVGLAGSPGMAGAAFLASLAAMRGGSGIVHLLYPSEMEMELAAAPYEILKLPYQQTQEETQEEMVLSWMQKGHASFAGPGMGRTLKTRALLAQVLPQLTRPCVLDADGLNALADHPFPLPPHTVLTPHRGEMERLLGHALPATTNRSLLEHLQQYAEKQQVTLLLKGAPTFIFHPGLPIRVNPTGDPCMATAGTGDLLTGLIASLLSQGLSPSMGAQVGAYLHGRAGSLAAEANGSSRGVIASDILNLIGLAYHELTNAALI